MPAVSFLHQYVADNVLRNLYAVRASMGRVPCPHPSCRSCLPLLETFALLDSSLRSRFLSSLLAADVTGDSTAVSAVADYAGASCNPASSRSIESAAVIDRLHLVRRMEGELLDLLTLKCPHCNVAVGTC